MRSYKKLRERHHGVSSQAAYARIRSPESALAISHRPVPWRRGRLRGCWRWRVLRFRAAGRGRLGVPHCESSLSTNVSYYLIQVIVGNERVVAYLTPKVHELLMKFRTLRWDRVVVQDLVLQIFLQLLVQSICHFLEILLEELEQILLGTILLYVVSVHIGPFQHSAILPNLMKRLIQKLKFYDLEPMPVMQRLHIPFNLHFLLHCQLHGFIMVHEPLEEKHILVQRMLGFYSDLFVLSMSAFFRLLVIDVALIIPSSSRIVQMPFAQAEPTELVAASTSLRADHVVAALVLLDRLVAFRALLRVGPYPTDIFRLGAILDVPLVNRLTTRWAVSFLATSPARQKAATASYLVRVNALVLTGQLATAWIRTPFYDWVVVNVRTYVPFSVFLLPVLVTKSGKKIRRNSSTALGHRTACLYYRFSVIYLARQITRPAILAQPMPALDHEKLIKNCHAHWTRRLTIGVSSRRWTRR